MTINDVLRSLLHNRKKYLKLYLKIYVRIKSKDKPIHQSTYNAFLFCRGCITALQDIEQEIYFRHKRESPRMVTNYEGDGRNEWANRKT